MDYFIVLAGAGAFVLALCAVMGYWPFEKKGIESVSKEDNNRSYDFPFRGGDKVKQLPDVFALFITLDKGYLGSDVLDVFDENGVMFGVKGIFHRYDIDGEECLFSVARSSHPGTFNPDTLVNESIKGLALFMKPKLQADPVCAFDAMVAFSKHVQSSLGGVIKDKDRRELSQQDLMRIRADMIESFECVS